VEGGSFEGGFGCQCVLHVGHGRVLDWRGVLKRDL
jgi:hypothetical protein